MSPNAPVSCRLQANLLSRLFLHLNEASIDVDNTSPPPSEVMTGLHFESAGGPVGSCSDSADGPGPKYPDVEMSVRTEVDTGTQFSSSQFLCITCFTSD